MAVADCFSFTLSTGAAYAWTNVDFAVVFNGTTFSASGPLVQGLKYKASIGLEVDKQQITVAARPTDLINGAPFLVALRDGAFDGASRSARPRLPGAPRGARRWEASLCSKAACPRSTGSGARPATLHGRKRSGHPRL